MMVPPASSTRPTQVVESSFRPPALAKNHGESSSTPKAIPRTLCSSVRVSAASTPIWRWTSRSAWMLLAWISSVRSEPVPPLLRARADASEMTLSWAKWVGMCPSVVMSAGAFQGRTSPTMLDDALCRPHIYLIGGIDRRGVEHANHRVRPGDPASAEEPRQPLGQHHVQTDEHREKQHE